MELHKKWFHQILSMNNNEHALGSRRISKMWSMYLYIHTHHHLMIKLEHQPSYYMYERKGGTTKEIVWLGVCHQCQRSKWSCVCSIETHWQRTFLEIRTIETSECSSHSLSSHLYDADTREIPACFLSTALLGFKKMLWLKWGFPSSSKDHYTRTVCRIPRARPNTILLADSEHKLFHYFKVFIITLEYSSIIDIGEERAWIWSTRFFA